MPKSSYNLAASSWLRRIDWILMLAVASLLLISFVILFALAQKQIAGVSFNPYNQLLAALLGFILIGLLARTDYHALSRLGWPLYIVSLIFLVLVLFVGEGEAARWINIGSFQFQPAELMKLSLIILLPVILVSRGERHPLITLFGSLLIVLAPAFLVAIQPDLSTAIVIMVIWGALILFSQVPKKYLLLLGLSALVMLPLLYSQLAPYQRDRVTTFLKPEEADVLGEGYNIQQAVIALGSGQLLGRGVNSGTQSQLNFLPAQHTDFIFSVLGEKTGFVGASLTIGLVLVIILRSLAIASRAPDQYGRLLCIGVAALIFFHTAVNIGMNLELLPVTGLPLSFVSYGGTHLLLSMIGVGILQSVRVKRKDIAFGS